MTSPTPTEVINLWNGSAPGLCDNPGSEINEPDERVSNVSTPTLDVYLPDPKLSNGTAIVICSGGGYIRLASAPLGRYGADEFLPHGITVFSLKYRLAPPSKDVARDALVDVKRAMRLIRSRAAEWKLHPRRIGLVGFSAGANLILNLSCDHDDGNPSAKDPVERESCRPNFAGLLATWPHCQKISDFKITSDSPPAFIGHTLDDTTAEHSFAEQIATQWELNGRPVHFESYPTGTHMAFNFPNPPASDWPEKFRFWLKRENLLPD